MTLAHGLTIGDTTFMAISSKPEQKPTHTVGFTRLDSGLKGTHTEGVVIQPPILDTGLERQINELIGWRSIKEGGVAPHIAMLGVASFFAVSGASGEAENQPHVTKGTLEADELMRNVVGLISQHSRDNFIAVTVN